MADLISDFLSYIRTTRTHLGQDEKSRIEERIKKKRRTSGQFQIFALFPQFSALFTGFILPTFYLVSLLFIMYSFIVMLL